MKTTAIIAIACLMVVSIFSFAASRIQATEPNLLNEEDAMRTDIKQASGFAVTEKSDNVSDSSRILNEQTLDENEPTLGASEANQNQVSDLPLPLPDGRIFLQSGSGTEDPIAYIPTQDPKTGSTTPIEPPELDI